MKEVTDINFVENIVNELYLIETNEGCHEDYLEDYETSMDFYLSNVLSDDYETYVREYCSSIYDVSISKDLIYSIIELLENKIRFNNSID
ncbi:TPA: hypothetical protein KSK42_003239 [Clostridioides difficile]|nr:hypothetical protein [Clostridioides difficile]